MITAKDHQIVCDTILASRKNDVIHAYDQAATKLQKMVGELNLQIQRYGKRAFSGNGPDYSHVGTMNHAIEAMKMAIERLGGGID